MPLRPILALALAAHACPALAQTGGPRTLPELKAEVQERGTREYLFELFDARAAIYGAKTLDEFLAYGPKMSLKTAGWLEGPSAPMLVINDMRDTQVPVEDLFLLMRSGSPREIWINPQGGHMGRNVALPDQRTFETETLPWVVRMLK